MWCAAVHYSSFPCLADAILQRSRETSMCAACCRESHTDRQVHEAEAPPQLLALRALAAAWAAQHEHQPLAFHCDTVAIRVKSHAGLLISLWPAG